MARYIQASKGLSLVLISACAANISHAVTFTDSQFLNANWTASKVYDSTPGASATFSAFHNGSGGNPSDYRHTIHNYASGQMAIYHENNLASCNIVPSNPITTIDYSFDSKVFSVGASGAVAYGLALRQGSNIYIHYNIVLPGPWSTFSFTGLTAANFTALVGAGTPNFSLAGPMEFGYFTANGTSGGATFSESGIDNWRVTANCVVPEPSSSIALAGFAGALLLRRRASRP